MTIGTNSSGQYFAPNLTTNGLLYAAAGGIFTSTSAGSSGQLFRATGGAPGLTTATYPSTAGSSGNLLTSDGTNWNSTAAPALAGYVLIQTQNASSQAALTFTTGITATYNTYKLICTNVTVASSAFMGIQISTNAGVSYISSAYESGASTSIASMRFGNPTTTTTLNTEVNIFNLTSGVGFISSTSLGVITTTATGANTALLNDTNGYTVAATTVNALQVVLEGGANFSGTFSLYGLRT